MDCNFGLLVIDASALTTEPMVRSAGLESIVQLQVPPGIVMLLDGFETSDKLVNAVLFETATRTPSESNIIKTTRCKAALPGFDSVVLESFESAKTRIVGNADRIKNIGKLRVAE